MTDPSEVFVLYPNRWGELDVVAVGDLYGGLIDDEDEDLDSVTTNVAIDTIKPDAIQRVRRLNETGDASAYWSGDDDQQ